MNPNTELNIVRFLKRNLDVPVGTTRPSDMTYDPSVMVLRTGSIEASTNPHEVDAAVVLVVCMAMSPSEAISLAGQVSDHMTRLTRETGFTFCSEPSVYMGTDASGKPNYRLTYRVTYVEE